MIELYAIADASGPPLPRSARLEVLDVAGLTAVYGPAEADDVDEDALWRREEVVEALAKDRDLLPVRYGTRLADERALARALEERRESLLAALDHVRGAAELSVRALAAAPQDHPRSLATGADYLRARAGAEEARERAARQLHEPLSSHARDSARRACRDPSELLRAAYLVERDSVEEFTRAVATLQSEHPEYSVLCTGPWPPYSFVRG